MKAISATMQIKLSKLFVIAITRHHCGLFVGGTSWFRSVDGRRAA